MKYCVRCVYPANHPLQLVFDDQGVCSGCRVHEEKEQLDWAERLQRLRRIVGEYRSRSRTIHDCIVPVSGARDSYFIVYVVKHLLGLRPLLVNYNRHYNTQVGIRNLAYLRSLFGCDFMQMTVSPERVKRITRETLRLRGSMHWHCLAGQTVFPVQLAVKFKIPLIIWGVHQGVDQVGMYSHLDEVEMTRKYRKEHDLMGLDTEDLLGQAATLQQADLEQYRYPHDKEIEAIGVRGIYLSNYIRWDTKAQHELMIGRFGYETAPQQRTFDCYNDADCFHYSGVHDHLKLLKWGYGKVSDHASRELRWRRLTRARAAQLVAQYQDVEPRDLPLLLRWLEMSESEFRDLAERCRNPDVWLRDGSGHWRLRDSIAQHLDDPGTQAAALATREPCEFVCGHSRADVVDDHYVLVGRGWVDGWSPPAAAGVDG